MQRKDQELPIHDVISIDCCKRNVDLEFYAHFFKIGPATTHITTLHNSLYSRGHSSWTDFTLWWLPKAYLQSNSCWNNNNQKFKIKQYFFPTAQLPLVCEVPNIIDASLPYSDTPPSVGLLWKGDRIDAGNSTWQHTKLITDRHPCPCEILTHAAPGIGKIKVNERKCRSVCVNYHFDQTYRHLLFIRSWQQKKLDRVEQVSLPFIGKPKLQVTA